VLLWYRFPGQFTWLESRVETNVGKGQDEEGRRTFNSIRTAKRYRKSI
jgi:hypothetical protein